MRPSWSFSNDPSQNEVQAGRALPMHGFVTVSVGMPSQILRHVGGEKLLNTGHYYITNVKKQRIRILPLRNVQMYAT